MKRPDHLVYGSQDRPSFLALLILGLQYVVVVSTFLLLPIVMIQGIPITKQIAASIVSTAMLKIGFTAILQVILNGKVGSGYFIHPSPNPVYMIPSILALQTGGLSVVFAMTAFAGVCQAFLARIFKNIHRFFPTEIAGLIILLIGMELGILGFQDFFKAIIVSKADMMTPCIIAIVTFALILICTLSSKTFLRLYALIIAISVGYLTTYLTGHIHMSALMQIKQAPWFAIPRFPAFSIGYHFESTLILPFLIAVLTCAIKVSGAVITHQRLNNAQWHEPEMNSVGRGILIDGLGTFFCGLLGTFGQNVSSSAVGVSVTSGVSCRRVAYAFAGIFWIMGFCPKFALVLVLTPPTIAAVTLIFLATSLVITGLSTMLPRMHASYRVVIIGIAFILGICRDIYPDTYQQIFSGGFAVLANSSISVATLAAVVLNLLAITVLDDNRIARTVMRNTEVGQKEGEDFLMALNRDWKISTMLYRDTQMTYKKLMEALQHTQDAMTMITLDLTLSRSQLSLTLSYQGKSLEHKALATMPCSSYRLTTHAGDQVDRKSVV